MIILPFKYKTWCYNYGERQTKKKEKNGLFLHSKKGERQRPVVTPLKPTYEKSVLNAEAYMRDVADLGVMHFDSFLAEGVLTYLT